MDYGWEPLWGLLYRKDNTNMGKMVLWETRFTLQSKRFTDKWADYWYSTTPIEQHTEQEYWDKIHPGYHTVSGFSCVRYTGHDPAPRAHITELGAR